MTTIIRFLEPLANLVSQRTGVEFVAADESVAEMWGQNSGVIVRRSGGMAIVFDPAGQPFCVGVIAGDEWIKTGYDIEVMMNTDPDVVEILAGRKDPFSAWKEPAKPKPKQTRFTLKLYFLDIVFRW